ncbi:hypothetical protein [Actinomycetospora sp.]|uniref:hypothetical protein n=1 Tax=Actinomycetospora sp. TaxID=1872135 RepID=UPI002F4045E7
MLTTVDIRARLDEVRARSAEALAAAQGDRRASAVTVAVVREFDTKAAKACAATDGAERDGVLEVEQAADSARVAVGADAAAAAETREAVEAAHLAICILKTEV